MQQQLHIEAKDCSRQCSVHYGAGGCKNSTTKSSQHLRQVGVGGGNGREAVEGASLARIIDGHDGWPQLAAVLHLGRQSDKCQACMRLFCINMRRQTRAYQLPWATSVPSSNVKLKHLLLEDSSQCRAFTRAAARSAKWRLSATTSPMGCPTHSTCTCTHVVVM